MANECGCTCRDCRSGDHCGRGHYGCGKARMISMEEVYESIGFEDDEDPFEDPNQCFECGGSLDDYDKCSGCDY